MIGVPRQSILVTGATGYVGGRLAPLLAKRGHRVRCLAREPERLEGRSWSTSVQTVRGDVSDPDSLRRALQGIDTAYYLIHSMRDGADFAARDLQAARNFGQAASACGVRHIVYLGGLGSDESAASDHLRSRRETGEALRESKVPVTELRAGVVVGSGSLGFELVRYLTERLPILICPRWVFTRTQPIAVRDLLSYLVAAAEREEVKGLVLPIGGADTLSYGEMMLGYAQVRGLRRRLLPVPVLSPRLSSYWIHFVTPVPATIARPLVLGLRNESVVRGDLARRLLPDITPVDYETAVGRSLKKLQADGVETTWASALSSSEERGASARLTSREGMILEQRQRRVNAPADTVFAAFTQLGGSHGWPALEWAWHLRGEIDRLLGGVGMRRGRRHPTELAPGDPVDFWRVEAVRAGRMIRLRAEMRVPGRAWLEFEAHSEAGTEVSLRQTAYFAPRGVFGLLYWYALYPIHAVVFGRLIAALARKAEAMVTAGERKQEPASHSV